MNPLVKIVIVASIASLAAAAAVQTEMAKGEWLSPEFSVLQKVYEDCQDKQEFTGCLKGKALTALTRAIEQVRSSYRF